MLPGREPNTINSDIILSKSKYLTLKCVTFVTFVTFWHRCQYDTALFVTLCCDSRIVRWQEILSPSSLCTAVFDEIIPSRKRWDYLSFLLSRIFGDPKELCSNGERPPGTPKSSARMGRAESEVGSTAAELQVFSIFLMNAMALFRFIEIR